MIEFVLDGRSKVNTYMQLVQQVKQALRVGLLEPGDQLPKVRDVAQSLAINPNTVLKAYRELEIEGLAEGRPGVGTFVTRTPRRRRRCQPGRAARGPGRLAARAAGGRARREDIAALVETTIRAAPISRGIRRRRQHGHGAGDRRAGQAVRRARGRCGTARCSCRPAGSPRWSGRTGRARPRCCTWRSGCCGPTPGTCGCSASAVRQHDRAGRDRLRRPGHPALPGLHRRPS